jgi:hypothetical protein
MIHSWVVGRLFFVGRFSRRFPPDIHRRADAERAQSTTGGLVMPVLPKISCMFGSFR